VFRFFLQPYFRRRSNTSTSHCFIAGYHGPPCDADFPRSRPKKKPKHGASAFQNHSGKLPRNSRHGSRVLGNVVQGPVMDTHQNRFGILEVIVQLELELNIVTWL
jgi:hypothetical protein